VIAFSFIAIAHVIVVAWIVAIEHVISLCGTAFQSADKWLTIGSGWRRFPVVWGLTERQ